MQKFKIILSKIFKVILFAAGGFFLVYGLYLEITHTGDNSEDDDPGYSDGIYSATAKLNDSATYKVDVKISGDSIVQINFPNGYYLLEDSIIAAPIDKGYAIVEGVSGKTFEIEIEEKE